MIRTPPSSPTTSPVAAFEVSCPMTVDSASVSRTTLALSGPTSTTRPASAPPAATATSPTSIPSFVPLSSTTSRRNSDDSRAITDAAVVVKSNPARSWRSAVRESFSRRISSSRAASVVSRSFSARRAALSMRRRSISTMAAATEATLPAALSSAPWIGRNAKPTAFWNSRTVGLDEKAIIRTVATSRTVNRIPRRRAALVARIAVMTVRSAGRRGSARRA